MTDLTITSARLLDGDGLWDVRCGGGLITSVTPRAGTDCGGEHDAIDASGGLLIPGFVECHFHPDKALTRGRLPPVVSTRLEDTMAAGAAVKRGFTHQDIVARATHALRGAVAHGITTMRAQVDVDSVIGLRGLEAMLEVRTAFAAALDLQLVAFPQQGIVRDPGVEPLLVRALSMGADLLGGGPGNEQSADDGAEHLRRLFVLAGEHGCGLDIHIDMAEDPEQRFLEELARLTVECGFEGRVTASHCCALASYSDDLAMQTIARVREAGIQICLCPMGNLLLADDRDEPRGRGASRAKPLLAGGVNVALGSDNVNDVWFRFGRLDPAEVAMVSALSMGMRTDAEIRDVLDMVTTRAARFAGLPAAGVEVGAPADIVLFGATTIDDVLRGASLTRRTFKRGRLVAGIETRLWAEL